jgi:hypothetical protein
VFITEATGNNKWRGASTFSWIHSIVADSYLLSNVWQGCKGLSWTNAQSYLASDEEKRFLTLTPVGDFIKHFTLVTYKSRQTSFKCSRFQNALAYSSCSVKCLWNRHLDSRSTRHHSFWTNFLKPVLTWSQCYKTFFSFLLMLGANKPVLRIRPVAYPMGDNGNA